MKFLQMIWRGVNRPLPAWTTLMLFATVAAGAAVPIFTGSLSVPSTGTITDANATVSTCVGTTSGKVYTYATNCVQSVTGSGNMAVSAGPTPNVTITNAPSFTGPVSGSTLNANGSTTPSSGAAAAITYNRLSTQGEMDLYALFNDSGAPNGNTSHAFYGYNNGTLSLYGSIKRNGSLVMEGPLEGSTSTNLSGTSSYVPPVYTSAGAAVASTLHGVIGTCTFSSSTSCAVTLTGGAVFSSATSYSCFAEAYSSGAGVVVQNGSGSSMSLETLGVVSISATIPYTCFGT